MTVFFILNYGWFCSRPSEIINRQVGRLLQVDLYSKLTVKKSYGKKNKNTLGVIIWLPTAMFIPLTSIHFGNSNVQRSAKRFITSCQSSYGWGNCAWASWFPTPHPVSCYQLAVDFPCLVKNGALPTVIGLSAASCISNILTRNLILIDWFSA